MHSFVSKVIWGVKCGFEDKFKYFLIIIQSNYSSTNIFTFCSQNDGKFTNLNIASHVRNLI